MILGFYAVLNCIAVYLFIRLRTRLHILEIMVYWMVASYLVQNFSALCYMNFKTLTVPEVITYELAHFLSRMILYPVLIVAFLHFYLVAGKLWRKVLLIVEFILFLVGLEWLADALRVLIHVHWRLWWSFAIWSAILMICLGFMKFFRILLCREAMKV